MMIAARDRSVKMSVWVSMMMLAVAVMTTDAHAAYSKIFTLERSQNKNQVNYEVDLQNKNNPIHVFWIMNEEDGHLEELTRLERNRAYGTALISQSDTELKFVIKSFQARTITVKLDAVTKLPYATISLDEKGEKILKSIFLRLGGGIIPSVKLVDFYYQDTLDGPILHDTFDPN